MSEPPALYEWVKGRPAGHELPAVRSKRMSHRVAIGS
jgi:hypothetical protein